MKVRHLILIASISILTSCGPASNVYVSNRYGATDYDREIIEYEMGETIPDNARKVGEIHVGDSGFSTDCGYQTVRQKLMIEVRKTGGHAVQIYEHNLPNFWSTCHSMKAYVFRLDEEVEPNTEFDN